MPYSPVPLLILCLPFVIGLALPLVNTDSRQRSTWLMLGTTASCLLLTLFLWPALDDGAVLQQSFAWLPALGLNFDLRVDGLSWLFMLLISGIGLLVGIYARYYMPRNDTLAHLFSLLLLFMGAMLGIVMAGNVIQLVFFWELTSLLSFLLIGYWHHGESARDAARTALITTGAGGLCLLAGMLLLGHVAGSYDIDAILGAADRIQASPLYLPALLLILIGALSKSAQFPFHYWLPQAMSAPTPVSAYLHSATLVKAGAFVLLRLWPVLAGTAAWFWIVGGIGLFSLLLGAWVASFQRDLKAILAYSTISHIGLITMLIGLGNRLGAVAAIFHIVNHATFKASLFMAAGAVDSETGTRDLRRLGGLRHVMPVTTTLAVIAAAAMAGVPLLNGFLSKEMFFAVALQAHDNPWLGRLTVIMAVAGAALSVAYSLRLVARTFCGGLRNDYPRIPNEPPPWLRFPIAFLALTCLAVGMLPALVIGPVLHTAATAVLGPDLPAFSLRIWHGVNAPLLMSVLALALGGAFCLAQWRWFANRKHTPLTRYLSAKLLFDQLLLFVTTTLPRWQQRLFPSRHLQPQLLLIVLMAAVIAGAAAWPLSASLRADGTPVDPAFALLWLLGCGCAIGAASRAKFHRVAALLLTGVTGLIVCVSFVWLSAPDLALTQLLVETVTTVLLLLGLRWLPRRLPGLTPSTRRMRLRRRRDFFIAIAVGSGLAVLTYAAMLHPVSGSVSQFYLNQALPGSGGHNVVNTILVDFRALDTLGEITVLAIVAVTVLALLKRFRPAPESIGMTRQQRRFLRRRRDQQNKPARPGVVPDYLAVPSTIITLMTPLIALFAVHLFLRGHDLPGGGFAAGITLSMALIVLYMARGARWVEARLRVAPLDWIGTGLLLAVCSGGLALLLGQPFLTTFHATVAVPVLGQLSLTSALLFDLAVFAVVVGTTSLILVVLAHQSLRRPVNTTPNAGLED